MTAKRFTLIECNGNIEDGCTQNVYDGGEDVFELLDLLNSLNNKNEQLKQKLELYGEIYPTGKWITKLNSEELEKELRE